jgi:hypothetical protein
MVLADRLVKGVIAVRVRVLLMEVVAGGGRGVGCGGERVIFA